MHVKRLCIPPMRLAGNLPVPPPPHARHACMHASHAVRAVPSYRRTLTAPPTAPAEDLAARSAERVKRLTTLVETRRLYRNCIRAKYLLEAASPVYKAPQPDLPPAAAPAPPSSASAEGRPGACGRRLGHACHACRQAGACMLTVCVMHGGHEACQAQGQKVCMHQAAARGAPARPSLPLHAGALGW